jgi:hypothetical protein
MQNRCLSPLSFILQLVQRRRPSRVNADPDVEVHLWKIGQLTERMNARADASALVRAGLGSDARTATATRGPEARAPIAATFGKFNPLPWQWTEDFPARREAISGGGDSRGRVIGDSPRAGPIARRTKLRRPDREGAAV